MTNATSTAMAEFVRTCILVALRGPGIPAWDRKLPRPGDTLRGTVPVDVWPYPRTTTPWGTENEVTMRKLFALAVMAATLAAADDAAAQSFEFGPVAGVSIANFSGDVDDTESRTGFFGGAQVVWQTPGSLFGFETGAIYVQKGADFAESDGEGAFELSYIAIPLMLRVAPPLGASALTPVFGFGGEAAFEVGCTLSIEGDDTDCDDADTFDRKSFDFGLSASVGVDVPVGRMTLAPFAKYTIGVTSINDSSNDDEIRNSGFLVGAALRF